MIEQRSRVQWRWGPLTSVQTPLKEIDSSGEGGNDVMQLVCLHDVPTAAQEVQPIECCEKGLVVVSP